MERRRTRDSRPDPRDLRLHFRTRRRTPGLGALPLPASPGSSELAHCGAAGRLDARACVTQDEYIADVEPFFAANDFYEIDIGHRIERFGQVAHAWSLYEARTSPDSPVVIKRGANSIQLCHDQGRWWVVSTIWDNEREGVRFDLW